MRINVYSQELTSEIVHVKKESNGRQVTGIPCLPNGQPNGNPRCILPDFLVEIWERNGRPDYQNATNPYRDVREEPIVYHAAQMILHSSEVLRSSRGDGESLRGDRTHLPGVTSGNRAGLIRPAVPTVPSGHRDDPRMAHGAAVTAGP